MADKKPVTKKLSELGPSEGFIASRDMQPTQPTHMNLGKDPATMEFEIRDPEPDELPEPVDEVPAVGQHIPTDEGRLQLLEEVEEADGLDELIDLSESDDGKWLLLPIGDVLEVRVAKSLPQRRYQKMIKLMKERKALAGEGVQISDLDEDEIDQLLTMSEQILKLAVPDEDWGMVEEGLDSLEHPIGPAELGPALTVLIPRYTKGTGAAKGKSQG